MSSGFSRLPPILGPPLIGIYVSQWVDNSQGAIPTPPWIAKPSSKSKSEKFYISVNIHCTPQLKSVPESDLDSTVEDLAARMATVPVNQLMMQKIVVNQAIEVMELKNTKMVATILDGITQSSPEGLNFKAKAEEIGWSKLF